MAKVTAEQIIKANRYGLNGGYSSYYTPVLEVAARLGNEGIDLSTQPIVTGRRYGYAPESFLSYNYAENRCERGLSLVALEGQPDMWSAMFLTDRAVVTYSGVLLPFCGSDGEPLILSTDADCWD